VPIVLKSGSLKLLEPSELVQACNGIALPFLLLLNDLYSSSNIVRVIKSRRMRWAGHVARMGEDKRRIQGFGGET
jgi:hypothetical protein